MTVTYSTFDSLQGSFYPLSLDRPPHDIDLNTFLSHAPESHPGSLKSHPQSQLIPLRFDWILMLCASYSPLYINLSILFISDILPLLPYLNRKESSAHRTHICDHTPHITIWQLQSPHSILITSCCILLTLLIPLRFDWNLMLYLPFCPGKHRQS